MGNHMQELEQIIAYQLKQKQHCLYVIGKKVKNQFDIQTDVRSGRDIVDSTILCQCINCRLSDECQMQEEEREKLGFLIEDQGEIDPSKLIEITSCGKANQWVKTAKWIYEKELTYHQMEQQLIETRKSIGKQYLEASETIDALMSKEGQPIEIEGKQLRQIQRCLKGYGLKMERGYRVSNPQIGEQLFIFLKGKGKSKYPAREIASSLSRMLEERWKPLVRMKQGMLGFQLESKFHVLSGITSKAYEENGKNGDNFSLYQMNSGKYVSMISDGMGTGNLANKDSKGIIEAMEELLETGVKEEAAIQCVQMMYSYLPRKERYATLDYLQINLESGIAMFLKLGACPSFLIRREQIEIISFDGMPVGYGSHMVPMRRKKLEADDFVLQVSDGCIDGFAENGLQKLIQKISEIGANRPQKFVETLMKKLMEDKDFYVRDDITMIGLAIVDKY